MSVYSDLGPFGIVPRSAIAKINGNGRAMIVYCVLASHADRHDDKGWKMARQQIADEAGIGLKTVARALAELSDLGLVEIVHNYTPDGDLGWSSYRLKVGSNVSLGDPESDPVSYYPKTDPSTDPTTCTSSDERPSLALVVQQPKPVDRFDEWWSLYPRKVAKADARKAWAKMKPAERDEAVSTVGQHSRLWTAEGRGTSTIPYPASWLNGRRWEDELAYQPPRPQTAQRDNGINAILRRRRDTR